MCQGVERGADVEALFEGIYYFRNDGETNDKFRVSFSMVWYILEMCIFKMFCEYIFCVDGLNGKMIGNLKGGGIFMEGKKDFPK